MMCGRFLPIVSDGGWHPILLTQFCFPIFTSKGQVMMLITIMKFGTLFSNN